MENRFQKLHSYYTYTKRNIESEGAIMTIYTKRTHCVCCGKKLKRRYTTTSSNNEAAMAAVAKEWPMGGVWSVWDGKTYFAYNGLFHSLRCALEFATGAYNAGYRKRKRIK